MLNPLLDKFEPKNSKLFILIENWHTWYIEDADSYSDNSFLNCQPKSIFGQIWAEKVKAVCFAWNLAHPHIHTQYLEDVDFISILVLWNSKPKSIFWPNLSRKTSILHFAWKLVYRVPWGCDCTNKKQGLEEKIKMNNCNKCLLLLYLYRS